MLQGRIRVTRTGRRKGWPAEFDRSGRVRPCRSPLSRAVRARATAAASGSGDRRARPPTSHQPSIASTATPPFIATRNAASDGWRASWRPRRRDAAAITRKPVRAAALVRRRSSARNRASWATVASRSPGRPRSGTSGRRREPSGPKRARACRPICMGRTVRRWAAGRLPHAKSRWAARMVRSVRCSGAQRAHRARGSVAPRVGHEDAARQCRAAQMW